MVGVFLLQCLDGGAIGTSVVLQQRLIFVPSRQWYVLRAMPTLRSGSSFATAVPFRSPSSCRLRFLTTEESTPRPAAACRDVISPDATLSTASRLGPSGTGQRLTRRSPGASSSIHAAGSALLGYPNRRIVRFARRPCVR